MLLFMNNFMLTTVKLRKPTGSPQWRKTKWMKNVYCSHYGIRFTGQGTDLIQETETRHQTMNYTRRLELKRRMSKCDKSIQHSSQIPNTSQNQKTFKKQQYYYSITQLGGVGEGGETRDSHKLRANPRPTERFMVFYCILPILICL